MKYLISALLLLLGCSAVVNPVNHELPILKIDVVKVDDNDAVMLQQQEEIMLHALYQNALSPYPEAITDEQECPARFKPVKHEQNGKIWYTMYATERLTFGACAEDIARYHALLGWLFCDGELHTVRIYADHEPEKTFLGLTCEARA